MLKTCFHVLNRLVSFVQVMMDCWIVVSTAWLYLLSAGRSLGCMWLPLWNTMGLCRGVTTVGPALWIMEGWSFIVFWLFSPPKGDGELWWTPKGSWDFIKHCWETYFWEEFGWCKEKMLLVSTERKDKVVGWGNICERWPLSATFTSWLMLSVGVTYTNRASCMALYFADFKHSRVCLCRLWSVFDQWIEIGHSGWKYAMNR